MALDVRIWAVDISKFGLWSTEDGDRGVGLIQNLLSDEQDQKRVTRFVREIDQIRSLAGKLLIRLTLKHVYPYVAWNDIVVACTPEGRPYVVSPKEVAFDFNITHDGDWVAIAYSSGASNSSTPHIGVDVMEIHLPAFEQSVAAFVETMDMTLTSAERHWILHANDLEDDVVPRLRSLSSVPTTLSEHDQACLFRLYSLWTYKEAFTKAHGVGLSFDFARIEVAIWHRRKERGQSDDLIRVSCIDERQPTLHQAAFLDLLLPPGQSHATVSKAPGPGRGTGQPSLLVVAYTNPKAKQEQAHAQAIDAEQAERSGMLVRLSMDRLITESLMALNGR